MTMLRTLAFLLALVTYPLRFAFYALHASLYFLTKPGAAVLLPLCIVALGYLLFLRGNEWLDIIATVLVSFFRGFFAGETGETIHAWRGVILAVLGFFVVQWIVALVGGILRPLLHALPAPRRPFVPLAPLVVPRHIIRTEPARVVVKPAGRGRYRGNPASLQARLPADIREVLRVRPPAPEPEQSSPAGVVAAGEASSSYALPAQAPELDRGPTERPRSNPRPASPPEAKVPGRRPVPPSMPEPEAARDP